MRIDVVYTPSAVTPADLAGRTVVVVDVLRATTTIAVALVNGAKAVLPAASTEEALRLAQNLERDAVVLAGERKSVRIPGFALGNSPAEFGADAVGGKTVVMTTSNGTAALIAATGAREVIAGAAVNFGAVVARARAALAEHGDVLILCAGGERQYALEDAFAAGRLTKALLPDGGLKQVTVNDGAVAALELARHYGERWLRALRASAHGRELLELGFRADLEACAAQDTYPVLPIYADRRITAYRPANEG
ncbi:MAG TPA: 2-phosphosulfolactate phosphatase [Gemmatimonadales bacterium]|nr:2-phosphosulfolactate phosphatase [Gemmatimonadales bacterium]